MKTRITTWIEAPCSDFPTFFREKAYVYRGKFFVAVVVRNFPRPYKEIYFLSRNSRNKYYKRPSQWHFRVPTRVPTVPTRTPIDRKSTRLNSSHVEISYAV